MTEATTKPVTLALDFSNEMRHWREDYTCPLCSGAFHPERPRFNMAINGGSIVCDPCAEQHSPEGTWDAAESYLRGLEDIDTALCFAPAQFRAGLIARAFDALKWLAEYYEAVERAELDAS